MDFFKRQIAAWSKLGFVQTVSNGLVYTIPIILIGSYMLAILNLPIPAFQQAMVHLFGENWKTLGLIIHNATLNVMSLFTLISVSYSYALRKPSVQKGILPPIIPVIVTFSSYVVLFLQYNEAVTFSKAGATGMFQVLTIGVLAPVIFFRFVQIWEALTINFPSGFEGNYMTRTAFRAVIPATVTLLCFAAVRTFLGVTALDHLIGDLLTRHLISRLSGANFASVILIILLTQLLWFFGIHGGNVIMDNITDFALLTEVSTAGGVMFTKEFFDVFIYLGGAGATLGLLLALFLLRERDGDTRLIKNALLPAIFNINENLLYGLPMVFNPFFLIPMVATPLVLSVISYAALALELVPPVTEAVMWTTPIFLSGYVGTGSLRGALLQGVNLLASCLIYLPFVNAYKRTQRQNRLDYYEELKVEMLTGERHFMNAVLNRGDDLSSVARELVQEIEVNLRTGNQAIYLEYQPKVDRFGRVVGAEALLRWKHPIYGMIPPLVTVSLCDEWGIANKLGIWVIREGMKELARWNRAGYPMMNLSINLDPIHLSEDEKLIEQIQQAISEIGIAPNYIELELTEQVAINSTHRTRERLREINELGITLSIDDLGMGYSSLSYLSDFHATVVKVDSSLAQQINQNPSHREIVRSIVDLCEALHVTVVIEGVETKEQLEALAAINCRYFQGFYFSRSLSGNAFLDFIQMHGLSEEIERYHPQRKPVLEVKGAIPKAVERSVSGG